MVKVSKVKLDKYLRELQAGLTYEDLKKHEEQTGRKFDVSDEEIRLSIGLNNRFAVDLYDVIRQHLDLDRLQIIAGVMEVALSAIERARYLQEGIRKPDGVIGSLVSYAKVLETNPIKDEDIVE